MKTVFYIPILVSFFYLAGCKSADKPAHRSLLSFVINKPNAVEEYFVLNNWSFPFQMDSSQPILFGYSDSVQIFKDSSKIQARRVALFSRAAKRFVDQGIDSTCGYQFSVPSMYKDASGVYYLLCVREYKNNHYRNAGCECLMLDSGRIFVYQCLMKFKVLDRDSLSFMHCTD